MTKQKFKTLALSALLATAFTLPALAEENGAGGETARDRKAQEHYMKADTNKDGFLTKDEMLAQHKIRLDEMFAKSDTDKDGKLSKDELKKGREAMRAKMKERMKERQEKRGERMEHLKERLGEHGIDTPVEESGPKE